jgi:hypothetical protein
MASKMSKKNSDPNSLTDLEHSKFKRSAARSYDLRERNASSRTACSIGARFEIMQRATEQ